MSGDPPPDPIHKNCYRIEELAEYFKISKRTSYRFIEEGYITPVKIRNCLRVPLEEIRRFEKEIKEIN